MIENKSGLDTLLGKYRLPKTTFMFNSKTKTGQEESSLVSSSIVGTGTVISGTIETSGDLRIDGTLKGNIISKGKLLIGPGGTVDGDIYCRHADILGQINGNIEVKDLLQLKGKAFVNGDITTAKLFIEETASFNGQCKMGASVVELKQEQVAFAVNE